MRSFFIGSSAPIKRNEHFFLPQDPQIMIANEYKNDAKVQKSRRKVISEEMFIFAA